MSSDTIRQWRPPEEDIVPYRINVSRKYLDLTKQKLELTRLPRELPLPSSQAWSLGTPKSAFEPLLDAWLDSSNYNWREHEAEINNALPQHRTTIHLPSAGGDDDEDEKDEYSRPSTSTRSYKIHFVHKRSAATQHDNGTIPLLYIHGYPGSFIEVHKVIGSLTSMLPTHLAPLSATGVRFHVVVPSIPGLGFSDAATTADFGARETMRVFDALMWRLGYGARYVVACSVPGWDVAKWSFVERSGCFAVFLGCDESLLGTHEHTQQDERDKQRKNTERDDRDKKVMKDSKSRAGSIRSNKSGSSGSSRWKEVFKRPPRQSEADVKTTKSQPSSSTSSSAITASSKIQIQQDTTLLPQTRALALCDSPAGLLAHTLGQIHALGNLHLWNTNDILTWTMLNWLPGPEAALRWSHATSHERFLPSLLPDHATTASASRSVVVPKQKNRVRLGVVVYSNNEIPSEIPDEFIQADGSAIPITWSKHRSGTAGIPALDNALDFILDLRDFCTQLSQPPPTDAAEPRQSVDELPERPRTAIRLTDVGDDNDDVDDTDTRGARVATGRTVAVDSLHDDGVDVKDAITTQHTKHDSIAATIDDSIAATISKDTNDDDDLSIHPGDDFDDDVKDNAVGLGTGPEEAEEAEAEEEEQEEPESEVSQTHLHLGQQQQQQRKSSRWWKKPASVMGLVLQKLRWRIRKKIAIATSGRRSGIGDGDVIKREREREKEKHGQ